MVKIEPRLQQRSWPRKLGVVWKTGNRDERFVGSNPALSAMTKFEQILKTASEKGINLYEQFKSFSSKQEIHKF